MANCVKYCHNNNYIALAPWGAMQSLLETGTDIILVYNKQLVFLRLVICKLDRKLKLRFRVVLLV